MLCLWSFTLCLWQLSWECVQVCLASIAHATECIVLAFAPPMAAVTRAATAAAFVLHCHCCAAVLVARQLATLYSICLASFGLRLQVVSMQVTQDSGE